jgi:choline dehydrogenase-like flavoprotein
MLLALCDDGGVASMNGGSAADVLIIGAGLSGGVAALTLAQAGSRVVVLEQGQWTDPGTYPGSMAEFELLERTTWHPDPAVRRSDADYPIDVKDSDVHPTMFNGVGGGTILYGAHWVRLHPSDFRIRTLDGVADDWPIGWRDLWPWYDITDREFGASGLAGDPSIPPMTEYPLPPLPLSPAGKLMSKTLDRMGWHWWPGSNAIASRPYDGRRQCVQRGTCMTGCAETAKAQTDRTHLRKAEALGATIVTGARVRKIATNERGLATGAVFIDRNGVEQFQPAAVVLVAAGAIGTPRLLLLSKSPQHPNGLANSSGMVGKRLMVHPRGRVHAIFNEYLESWQGHAGLSMLSHQFYETDARRGFVRGAKWSIVPTRGPLSCALERDPEAQLWGPELHARVKRELGHTAAWGISGEDLPEESNQVTIGDETDSDGIPAPKVAYRLSENSRRLIHFQVEHAAEAFREAGAIEIETDESTGSGNPHVMGTARMGTSPRDSVVDQWGRAHDVPNLYIIDSSVFVTGGAANPSSTIAALAKRNVTHLVTEHRNQPTADEVTVR